MNEPIIKELNTFLEGNLMAIHAYENYIEHTDDENIKTLLQNLQQEHKQHATLIAMRIESLGGVPVDNLSIGGKIAEFIANLKGPTTETYSILQDALAGESRGIKKSKELLEGDLDRESLELVSDILNRDEQHVKVLSEIVQQID
ncbi:DUF2383 domain-containing protein [Anaerobacillus sp. MEB173]|uniref:DUF2383 domain-containing protein n=1 Tax=Anaerobacillus sp. MEB173 TaxID=3383345 RepID=UPI003F92BCD2